MNRPLRGWLRCSAFLLALFIGAGTCLAAGYRVCIDYQQCHSCDYFDSRGDYLYTIEYCWSN